MPDARRAAVTPPACLLTIAAPSGRSGEPAGGKDSGPAGTVADSSISDDLAAFIRASVTSIWTLELLLFLKRQVGEAWTVDHLVRELRGSRLLVTDIIASLQRSGLVVEEGEGMFRYRPASSAAADLVDRLERLSVEKPMTVRNAIVSAPHDKVQVFADAFKVKKD